MTVTIVKLGNTIKCKNDYDIKYFNIYESYYKIRGNIITIYSTGNSPENYTFSYNIVDDNIFYNPAPTNTLVTAEDHADYLASIFFLISNSNNNNNNIFNTEEYIVYENDFLINPQTNNVSFNDMYFWFRGMGNTGLNRGSRSFYDNSYIVPINSNVNGEFSICLNYNFNGQRIANNRILFTNASLSVHNTEHRSTSVIHKNTKRIIFSFIFKLGNFNGPNEWANKHTGTRELKFFMCLMPLTYTMNFNQVILYNATYTGYGLMYTTNSSLLPTTNLMFHLNNTKTPTSIDFASQIANNQFHRLDIIVKTDNPPISIVEIYFDNNLMSTYNVNTNTINNLMPFIYVEQNGFNLATDAFLDISFDYVLLAYSKLNNVPHLNKRFGYYNNKI